MSNSEITRVVGELVAETPQQRLVRLADERETLIDQLKDINDKMAVTMKALGEGTFTQDPGTLVVYKVVKPTGSFVMFKELDYVRTRKEGEDKGDLSETAAEEAGFITRTALNKSREKQQKEAAKLAEKNAKANAKGKKAAKLEDDEAIHAGMEAAESGWDGHK